MAEGGIRLVRTKLLPSVSGPWDSVDREIVLAVTYVRAQLGFEGPVEATVSALDNEATARLGSMLELNEGVQVNEAKAEQTCGDPGFAERVGRFMVVPVGAVLRGGAP